MIRCSGPLSIFQMTRLPLLRVATLWLLFSAGSNQRNPSAQRIDLNYSAIMGWYDGCGTSFDDRCDGLLYTHLPEPLYLELDTCYVNPNSDSSVTYYKQVPAGNIVAFSVIFTNEAFAQMPKDCNQKGQCSCGKDFGLIQREVGESSCNDLFSFTYQCRSQVFSGLAEEQASCYVPHYTSFLRDDDEILKCSMVAAITSLPPGTEAPTPTTIQAPDVDQTAAPSISPSTLIATDQPSSLSLNNDGAFQEPSGEQTTSPPNLRNSAAPTVAPIPSTEIPKSGTSSSGRNDDEFQPHAGVIAASAGIGVLVVFLGAWAGRPEGGYIPALQKSVVTCVCCQRQRKNASTSRSSTKRRSRNKGTGQHSGNVCIGTAAEGNYQRQPYNFDCITSANDAGAGDLHSLESISSLPSQSLSLSPAGRALLPATLGSSSRWTPDTLAMTPMPYQPMSGEDLDHDDTAGATATGW